MKRAKFPSIFSGYSIYRRGDYPVNIHRHYIPTGIILQSESRLKLTTEVLTYSASGSDTTYTLSSTPVREQNVFVYLNGIRQERDSFHLDGLDIVFEEVVPEGWSVIVSYSKI